MVIPLYNNTIYRFTYNNNLCGAYLNNWNWAINKHQPNKYRNLKSISSYVVVNAFIIVWFFRTLLLNFILFDILYYIILYNFISLKLISANLERFIFDHLKFQYYLIKIFNYKFWFIYIQKTQRIMYSCAPRTLVR